MPICRIRALLAATVCLAGSVAAVGGPLAEGAAGATAPAVVISELMYNPASGSQHEEFVELAVPGSAAVDVGGWCLSEVGACLPAGTRIAAGGYLVLARDPDRFATVYGRAADESFYADLSNSGQTLSLVDASGKVVDEITYGDRDPWPTTPDGGGTSLELRDPTADRSDPRDWAASTALSGATPGARNAVAATGLPPRITSVKATPTAPAPGTKVQVSAVVTGATSAPVVRVLVDQQAAVSIPMSAAGGDAFTATLPAASAGSLVRYRVEARGGGGTATWPRVDDTMPNASLVVSDGVTSKVPIVRWFLPEADYRSITANPTLDVRRTATIAFGDTVIDGATVKLRGNASRTSRKPNWKIELPKNHKVVLPGGEDAVDEFALQADWGDDSHGRAHLAWEAYRRAGIPAAVTFPVRVQRNGAFQGLYSFSEVYDGDWRDEHHLDKRPFYEASVYAWDATRQLIGYRYDKKSPDDGDYRDLQDFLAGVDLPATGTAGTDLTAQRDALLATADLPELINYAAVTAFTQHVDSSNKNVYLTQDPTTQRWSVLPWDLDHTFGNPCCEVTSPFVTPAEPGDRTSELMQLLLADPQWRLMYFRRLRTLIDSVIPPGTLEATYDQVYGPAAPEAALDVPAWPRPWTTNYAWARTQLRNGIAARYAAIKADPRLPASAAASPVITISEIKPLNRFEGFVELTNPSTAVAVDLSGWKVGGSVSAKLRPGTVLPPKGMLVVAVSELDLRALQGSRMFVAASTDEELPQTGTITLTRADGSLADTVTYGGSGWPRLPLGFSLELSDVRLNNAMASSWGPSTWPQGSPGYANRQARAPKPTATSVTVHEAVWNGDSARVTWDPLPSASGPWAITGYRVNPGGGRPTEAREADVERRFPRVVPATATSTVLTGLPLSYHLDFTVVPTTMMGELDWEWSAGELHTVTASQMPGRPAVTGATVAAGSSGSPATATVTWTAPGAVGTSSVLAYRVTALQVASSASTAAVIGRSEAPVTWGGARSVKLPLVPGTYRFVVEALNLTGWGPASARSAALVVP